MMNENLKKLTLVMLGFSLLLLLVSLALINNTIRLTVYSKRFLIKTMQLVGATRSFIRRPFIIRGIRDGIFASAIALLMVFGVVNIAQSQLPDISEMNDANTYLTLVITIVLLGIFISLFSTWFALRRYLRLKADDLYF
jgi:cell division transport system permease protein